LEVIVTSWLLRYDGYDPQNEPLREALCTLGNGRFATRGAAAEAPAGGAHYPGTYAAGVFNRLAVHMAGQRVENESMVNLPNWLSLTVKVEDGEWLDVDASAADGLVQNYVQELDLRRGVLTRRFRVTDGQGRVTAIAQRRFVSMADPFSAGLDTTVVAENWSGEITLRSGIDASVRNSGVARYAGLGDQHLEVLAVEPLDKTGVAVHVRTTQSRVEAGLAARHRVLHNGQPIDVQMTPVLTESYAGQDVVLHVEADEEHTVEKLLALYTSRDRAISEPFVEARDHALDMPDFDALLQRHVLAWDHLWARCDITLGAGDRTQMVLRLHLFHLLQTVSHHCMDLDVGIPARGLHGEAYRGHIFWDETFVYPYLNLRMPEVSRALLLYRWRRLPQARKAAREAGYAGAMFPWQSSANGREETQTLHLNPASGHWLPDRSHRQRHINVAVAYNTWQYYEATGDLDFLATYGAELLFEVARFWASIATYDRADDRYDIRYVMGPDEYHDAYPWRDELGLDNNAYTNVMVVWLLQRALRCVEVLPGRRRQQLMDLLDITRFDLERWEHMTRKIRLVFHDGVLSQFEGYEQLAELDWEDYRARYGDIGRLDRILEAEGDSTNNYRLAKQADVLMLFYLLSQEELASIIVQLGYTWDPLLPSRCVDYYLGRTAHGSTLSKLVHAWVVARIDPAMAWSLFMEAMESDVSDVQGGTTQEGIHLGAMIGTVDLLQRGFTGLETRGDMLRFDPTLPAEVGELRFRMRYRHHYGLEVALTRDLLTITGPPHAREPLRLRVDGEEAQADPGGGVLVALRTSS
jgi:trehalose/maltose hydrolase-like predicted phosphorylase